MAALSTEELHSALFGTWTAVGRVAELLIRRTTLSPEELGSLLTAAEMTATDRQSRVGIAIVRGIMESAVRHDAQIRSARSSEDMINQVLETGAEARAASADRIVERPAERRGVCGSGDVASYPMIKGSDFDDATMPSHRADPAAATADRRNAGTVPRSGPAPGPPSPQRIAERPVSREDASLLETAA